MNVNTENKEIIPMEQKDEFELSPEAEKIANPLLDLFNTLSATDSEFGDLEGFMQILALPNDVFESIAPMLLEEIEKEMLSPNTSIILSEALRQSGLEEEEFYDTFDDICESISKELVEDLTPEKTNFLKQFFAIIFNTISRTTNGRKVAQIAIEYIDDNAKMPEYARVGDAGMDIYAIDDYDIAPGETKIIPTGIKLAIPIGYEIQIRPKSGRCANTKLRIANSPATIDAQYRGEIGVIVENVEAPIKDITYEFDEQGRPMITSILHGQSYHIGKGEKFAQLVLNEIAMAKFYEIDSVEDVPGNRGGGFGSTGLTQEATAEEESNEQD